MTSYNDETWHWEAVLVTAERTVIGDPVSWVFFTEDQSRRLLKIVDQVEANEAKGNKAWR